MKRCSTSLIVRKIQIRIPMRYHFTATRVAIIKKMDTWQASVGTWGHWDLSCLLSCSVWLFATLWTVAHQAPLALGFSRQSQCRMWVAIFSSRGSSWPRDWTHVSCVSCTDRWILYHWATWKALYITSGNEKRVSLWNPVWQFFKKLGLELIPLLSIYLRTENICTQ